MTEPETRLFRVTEDGPVELGTTLAEARADHLAEAGFPAAAEIAREGTDEAPRGALTTRSQEKVAQALDAAAERLELALGYLDLQGCLDSAQRLRRVQEELSLARLVDDRLKAPQ